MALEILTSNVIRKTFLITLAAGILVITGVAISKPHPIIASLIPVAIMTAYLAWYLKTRKLEELEYAFADSFYYLGFIYTLFALLIAFFIDVCVSLESIPSRVFLISALKM